MDVGNFIRARLDEDQATAERWPDAPVAPGMVDTKGHPIYAAKSHALRQIEAIRQAVAGVEHGLHRDLTDVVLMDVVRSLASIWADHPDYDTAWTVGVTTPR